MISFFFFKVEEDKQDDAYKDQRLVDSNAEVNTYTKLLRGINLDDKPKIYLECKTFST